jgi:hypothetical protein
MLNLLRWFWKPKPQPLHCMIDFTKSRKDHWAGFDGGDNHDAMFSIVGHVQIGDELLIRMQSGRIGRYRVFSRFFDPTGVVDWHIRATAIGYLSEERCLAPMVKVQGLLGDGSGRLRSDSSQSTPLSSGFIEPSGDFWKVLCRDEARRGWTDSMRTTGDM